MEEEKEKKEPEKLEPEKPEPEKLEPEKKPGDVVDIVREQLEAQYKEHIKALKAAVEERDDLIRGLLNGETNGEAVSPSERINQKTRSFKKW